jgi:hydrogenase nickel incorporation protein HypA/HybF
MHELSLCRSIYTIVDRARGPRPVASVQVQVGHLRQVLPETLAHCWHLVTDDTPLRGSVLEVDHIPIELRCASCSATTSAPHRLVLTCGTCGSGDVAVTRGEELMVMSMQVRGEADG